MLAIKDVNPFEFGPDRYQPNSEVVVSVRAQYELNQRRLAFWVGCIGVGLPFVLLASAVFSVCRLDSISHYYYVKVLGDIFVGCLVFIGAFLIAYQGTSKNESRLANITGFATFGVAIFPTTGNGCGVNSFSSRVFTDSAGGISEPILYSLFPYVGMIHYACAAIVFVFLAFYTLFVFTRIDKTKRQRISETQLTIQKSRRNTIYYVSGALIIISILALIGSAILQPRDWDKFNLTFVFEAIALISFGVSWLVKGRFGFFGLISLDDPAG